MKRPETPGDVHTITASEADPITGPIVSDLPKRRGGRALGGPPRFAPFPFRVGAIPRVSDSAGRGRCHGRADQAVDVLPQQPHAGIREVPIAFSGAHSEMFLLARRGGEPIIS